MEPSTKKTVWTVISVVVIVLLGWWLFSSGSSRQSGYDSQANEAEAPAAQVVPALQLTSEEKSGDVSKKKAQVLAKVRSDVSLTSGEKSEIAGIMLTKADVYKFSEEERVLIFKALSKP